MSSQLDALAQVASELRTRGVPFALVGGLAVSAVAEVRFTRDVDIALSVPTDLALESLVRDLARAGYDAVAVIEQDERKRIAIARLRGPSGVVVDLLAASNGIEAEIVADAKPIAFEVAGELPVAMAEDLLAMKVLSMRPARLQDRIDAENLIRIATPDLALVRDRLGLIESRGFARGQDLAAKFDGLLAELAGT
jgi:hypothetical protein